MTQSYFGNQSFSVGDEVQQMSPIGLSAGLSGFHYVVRVMETEMELSKVPGGDPIRDQGGLPRKFSMGNFRRLAKTA